MARDGSRLAVLAFIIGLVLIMGGKLFFNSADRNAFLFGYGIAVTTGIITLFTVRYVWYRDPYEVAKGRFPLARTHDVPVSIMVAVHNEEHFIDRCLDSLLAQSYPHREIIVVDDASTDGTRAILSRYTSVARVIRMRKNVGKKRALARAMLEARGRIFVFTDSDTIVEKFAIERLVSIFEAFPDIGAISGHTRAYNASHGLLTRIQDSWYEGQFSIRKAYESIFGAVTCVSGPLAAFRRSAIFNMVPAWINDRFMGREFRFATDRTLTALVLGSRILAERTKRTYAESPFVRREDHPAKEWLVVYTKSARALTRVPETLGKLITQQVRWKKSFLRNIFLTGSFYWRKPLPVALMYYMRMILVFVGPLVVIRHLIWLPLNGNLFSGVLYVSGIFFVGFLFAIGHRLSAPQESGWVYRPLMNFLSTFLLSWILFYSVLTVRKMSWVRG